MGHHKTDPVIIVDANALVGVSRSDPRFWRLLDAVRSGEHRLAVPYVAFKEMVRRRALKQLERSSADRMNSAADLPHFADIMHDIEWTWGQMFKICGVVILGIEPAHMEEAHRRRREGLAPFKNRTGPKADNDFRDALIYCAVASAKEKYGHVLFACRDDFLRSTVADELAVPVRKDGNDLIAELFAKDDKIVADPFNIPSRGGRMLHDELRHQYSHPEFEAISPERSHNRLDIETKLNEVAADFKDQVCCLLAVARLLQPALIDDTTAALARKPFEYTDSACRTALHSLQSDGSVKIVGGVILVEDEDFAEQAIGRLGDRVIDLMRMFHE